MNRRKRELNTSLEEINTRISCKALTNQFDRKTAVANRCFKQDYQNEKVRVVLEMNDAPVSKRILPLERSLRL